MITYVQDFAFQEFFHCISINSLYKHESMKGTGGKEEQLKKQKGVAGELKHGDKERCKGRALVLTREALGSPS